jgi:hypothetical protein
MDFFMGNAFVFMGVSFLLLLAPALPSHFATTTVTGTIGPVHSR